MLLRRALYWVQFGMAVALPVWVLVSRGIVADGVGWQLVIYLMLCPILFLTLADPILRSRPNHISKFS